MQSGKDEKPSPLDVLVIDSGAIIKGHGGNFHTVANRLVTVEEVVAEIRDSKSREILLKLPFELEIHNPSDESMAAVARFAEKSGDFAALSLTDLKVMALAYTFEAAICETKHIRQEPIDNKTLQWRQQQQRNGASTTMLNVKKPAPAAAQVKTVSAATSESTPTGSEQEASCEENGILDQVGEQEELPGQEEEQQEGYDEEDYYEEGYGSEYGPEDEGEYGSEYEEEEEEEETEEPFSLDNAEEDFPSLGLDGFQADGDTAIAPSVGEETGAATKKMWGAGVYVEKPSVSAETVMASAPTPADEATIERGVFAKGRHFDAAAYLQRTTAASGPAKSIQSTPAAAPAVHSSQPDRDKEKSKDISSTSRILSGGTGGGTTAMSQLRAAFEDDGVGWINNENIKECVATGKGMIGSRVQQTKTAVAEDDGFTPAGKTKKASKAKPKASQPASSQASSSHGNKTKREAAPRQVGCVTTDFTMQNVLIQMNLHVINVDGMQIRAVKQWVLRCMACFTIHYDMDRLFCSKCGANHMSRVACSIDSKTGSLRLHLKKGYTPNRRGKQHSLPLPGKQGRFQGELLLREDQLLTGIWRQKTVKMQKDVRSAFGHDITSDVGLHINKSQAIRVGLGRANPNADKGRERRGAKKKKGKK